jgi:hypothetical protein
MHGNALPLQVPLRPFKEAGRSPYHTFIFEERLPGYRGKARYAIDFPALMRPQFCGQSRHRPGNEQATPVISQGDTTVPLLFPPGFGSSSSALSFALGTLPCKAPFPAYSDIKLSGWWPFDYLPIDASHKYVCAKIP